MKPIFLFTLLSLSIACLSQTQAVLEHNNVRAYLSTDGHFFNNPTGTGGYEVPKDIANPISAIFSNTFWFGGTDVGGQIKLAAQTYSTGSFQDFYPGPLSTFGGQIGVYGDANITPAQMAYYDQIWSISELEIQNHIQNYQVTGYVPISAISSWPAHGDASLGEAPNLAPFVDVNNDGQYVPLDGDYPKIRGDRASYMILNDKGGIHFSSGADPIGLELHIMAYQLEGSNHLDQTTFVNIHYINRGTQTIFDFKFSNFLDPDLGNSTDDFMGTNPSKNLVYAYNATDFDSDYGNAPPAIGVMTLCQPIESSCYFTNTGFAQLPFIASEYGGFMNAQWGNSGAGFTQGGNGFGGTNPTNFLYHDFDTWSEISEGNTPFDKRMLLTTSPGNEGTLAPGDQGNIDLAFIFARDSNHLASVNKLFSVADSTQDYYNQNFANECTNVSLSINKTGNHLSSFSIYPNPAKTEFRITVDGIFNIAIYDITGKIIMRESGLNQNKSIAAPLNSGIYLVKIQQNGKTETLKLIVE